jgi:hypothetical protein
MQNSNFFITRGIFLLCFGGAELHSQSPQGMSKVVENFFMDPTEISNLQYKTDLQCMGNVAEMLSMKGQAMGGSFIHQEKEVFAEEGLSHDGPERWVGFRWVCEIKHP